MNNYTDHVTSLLQNYRTTKRKIEQLRYWAATKRPSVNL